MSPFTGHRRYSAFVLFVLVLAGMTGMLLLWKSKQPLTQIVEAQAPGSTLRLRAWIEDPVVLLSEKTPSVRIELSNTGTTPKSAFTPGVQSLLEVRSKHGDNEWQRGHPVWHWSYSSSVYEGGNFVRLGPGDYWGCRLFEELPWLNDGYARTCEGYWKVRYVNSRDGTALGHNAWTGQIGEMQLPSFTLVSSGHVPAANRPADGDSSTLAVYVDSAGARAGDDLWLRLEMHNLTSALTSCYAPGFRAQVFLVAQDREDLQYEREWSQAGSYSTDSDYIRLAPGEYFGRTFSWTPTRPGIYRCRISYVWRGPESSEESHPLVSGEPTASAVCEIQVH